LAYRSLIFLRQ